MKVIQTDFKERLRLRGLKLTPQRLAIVRELSSTKSHPSAEWIYNRVKREQPTISLATVYKTLESLKKAGMVTKVCTHSDSRRYDWDVSPHPHLCCTGCGKVEDLVEVEIAALFHTEAEASRKTGYEILKGCFTLYGRCPDCRHRESAN